MESKSSSPMPIILQRRAHSRAEPERRVLADEKLVKRLVRRVGKVKKPTRCMEVDPKETAVRMKVILPHPVGIFTGSRIKTMGSLLQLPNDYAFTDQSSAKKLVKEITRLWEFAKPIIH